MYSRKDSVAMGSPLGPIIAGIFMVDLERNVIPKLSIHMNKWKRFADGTVTYIKPSSIDYVLSVLNSFHKNIKFTFEEEKNGSFTHNDVNLHRDSFSRNSWKIGTLKTRLLRAFVVCSNEQLLNRVI